MDDPSSHPEQFPTDAAQDVERQRLFRLIEELVKWENVNNEEVLGRARAEILKATDGNPPPLLDPFAGGGSIPLEAHASDLNPVAVLINKALIEIPPKFAGRPPLLSQVGGLGDTARDLAYRLYTICERKGWAQEALPYNGLVVAWSEVGRLAVEKAKETTRRERLFEV